MRTRKLFWSACIIAWKSGIQAHGAGISANRKSVTSRICPRSSISCNTDAHVYVSPPAPASLLSTGRSYHLLPEPRQEGRGATDRSENDSKFPHACILLIAAPTDRESCGRLD